MRIALAILLIFGIGCANSSERIAYYEAIEAEASRIPAPMIKITGPEGFTIHIADMRDRRAIPPPPKTAWEVVGRDVLQGLLFAGSLWMNAEMNSENNKTQREMFRAFGSSSQGADGATFKNVDGDIIYGDDNQQADRIGHEYDYRYEFTDNSDNSILYPSTPLRPEVVYSDVAIEVRPEVVTTERMVYP